MRIDFENYTAVPESEHELLKSLLSELQIINKRCDHEFYIDWQDYHDEYSCERTDPCPDYFGFYRLKVKTILNQDATIGTQMVLCELDNAICILDDYTELNDYGYLTSDKHENNN